MKMQIAKTLLSTAAAAVLVAAPAFAQEETVKPGAGCSRHHAAANASFDKGMALLDQATQANDGQKDQLLAQARQELTTAKGHMDQCAKECGTMSHDQMHGAAGGHGSHGGYEHGAAQGGHAGHHGNTAAGTQAATETDPVCGMKVSRNSEWKSVYAGKAYYFCNKEDKATFDKNPESFLKKKS